MDGGEKRAGQNVDLIPVEFGAECAERVRYQGKQPAHLFQVPFRHRIRIGHFQVEDGAPRLWVIDREMQIGAGHGDQPIARVGLTGSVHGLGHMGAETAKGAPVHGERQLGQVVEDVVDRAHGAASFPGQIARAQGLDAARGDGGFGRVGQTVAQIGTAGFGLGGHSRIFLNGVQRACATARTGKKAPASAATGPLRHDPPPPCAATFSAMTRSSRGKPHDLPDIRKGTVARLPCRD
jgi:hypothetical protein